MSWVNRRKVYFAQTDAAPGLVKIGCMTALAPIAEASLPALVRSAATKLANAESSAEVLDARDTARVAYDAAKSAARLARAKQAHDEIIGTVYRAQADALEIESLAKRRLADEYDAAQARGEVRGSRERTASNAEAVGAADLGLSHKDIHEARVIRVEGGRHWRSSMTLDPGLALALRAVGGNEAALARAAGVKQPTVWHWINTGRRRIPAERVPAVAAALGIPAAQLRPDVFGREGATAPASRPDPSFHGDNVCTAGSRKSPETCSDLTGKLA